MATNEGKICVFGDNETLILDNKDRVMPKISKASGNGIYIGDDGLLHLKKGNTPASSTSSTVLCNTPGNAVGGDDGEGHIEILRCHKMVTRMVQKPNDINVPTLITNIVDGILNWSDD